MLVTYANKPEFLFHDSSIKTTFAFPLIHCDLWGKYHTITHSECNIIDDYTIMTWIFLTKYKNEVFQYLIGIKKQYNGIVQIMRSDNSFEFLSNNF